MTIESNATARCRVCGCGRIQIDEVECDGILLLTECPRCHDRRTARLPASGFMRPRAATFAPPRSGGRSSHASPAAADAA
jgi:hypothetical protein